MKKIAFSAVIALALAGCQEEEAQSAEETVRPVRTVEVASNDGQHGRFFVGVARAAREATLAFGVSGTLQEFDTALGDEVAEGQVVAQLDAAPFQAEVTRLEAELASAQATFENAAAQSARQQELVAREVVSEATLDAVLAQEGSAEAAVRSMEAAVERAQLDLTYTTMRAPYDGIVVGTYVENFEEVGAQARVVRILDTQRIEMVIDVPERFISILPAVSNIEVTFTALEGVVLPAEVTEFGSEASNTTGTFPVVLQMEQPEGARVLPGMTGRARGIPEVDALPTAGIFIPPEAIFTPEGTDQTHVWIVDPGTMQVMERPVELGGAGSQGIDVVSGLEIGEIVVAAGANSLRSGQEVSLLDEGAN